ncbi:MAG TPA: cellulase N-terminal Ig-like domain-containing protein, partial [Bacteroidia bacterium]|nr:cellulase N-terminal Ig-like domain-containing protein [Bacteroidia bacterium]
MIRILLLMLIVTNAFGQAVITPYIKVDQIGYRPMDRKVAVISDPQTGYNAADSYTPGTTLEVRQMPLGTVVFSGTPTAWNGGATHGQSGDKVWWFDFTSITAVG